MLTSFAHAQPGATGDPRRPGGPGVGGPGAAPAGAPSGAAAAAPGTVTNESTYSETSVTTEGGADFGAAEPATLPTTGGEPLVLTLLGSLTAGSALLLRRKLS